MKRKAIVSIAAGASQLPLLERIRKAGFALIAVDRDPAAAGMDLADQALVLSTHDPIGIEAALGGLRERFEICAVMTKSSGPPVATCAEIARSLGCNGLAPSHAAGTIDKARFAKLCASANVTTPRTREVGVEEEFDASEFGPPWIAKPAITRVGKLAVSRIEDADELADAIRFACRSSADGRAVLQEYIEGPDFTVAALFHQGRVQPLALLDEHVTFTETGEALGAGFRLPSVSTGGALEQTLFENTVRLLAPAGTGLALIAFRCPPGKSPVAIEAHLDLAGDFVSDRLFAESAQANDRPSFDLIEAALRLAVDGSFPEQAPQFSPLAVRFLFADDLTTPDATQALGALPGVSEVRTDLPPTGKLRGGRVGYALVHGANGAELDDHLQALDTWLDSARAKTPSHA